MAYNIYWGRSTAPSKATPRTDLSLPECACSTPPWEECPHTINGFTADEWPEDDGPQMDLFDKLWA